MNKELEVFNDNNVEYNGASSTIINVKQGESVAEVLNKLVVDLSNLIERVNSCSFCEGEDNQITMNASDIVTNSTINQNPTIVSGGQMSIKTTPTESGINLNFDLGNVVSSLPGATIVSSKTSVDGLRNGFPTKLVDTGKISASVMLRPDNFPATLSSEVRYRDAQGEKTINLKVPVSNTSSELNLPLQGNSSASSEARTQEDLNSNTQDRLLNVENLANSLNQVNVSGFGTSIPAGSSINEAISFILSEIESIKAQLP